MVKLRDMVSAGSVAAGTAVAAYAGFVGMSAELLAAGGLLFGAGMVIAFSAPVARRAAASGVVREIVERLVAEADPRVEPLRMNRGGRRPC